MDEEFVRSLNHREAATSEVFHNNFMSRVMDAIRGPRPLDFFTRVDYFLKKSFSLREVLSLGGQVRSWWIGLHRSELNLRFACPLPQSAGLEHVTVLEA